MKTLIDSSVWISHFHRTDKPLTALMERREVAIHSCIIGELAVGSLKHRKAVLGYFEMLETITECTASEALSLIDSERLHGQGLSWIDCLLLASCRISRCALYTHDVKLGQMAKRLGIPAV